MSLDPNSLTIGPARIYLGGTAPASGAVVGSDTSGVPTNGGTEVGLTEGPTTFTVSGEIKTISAEQVLSPIRAIQSSEKATVSFKVKEIDWLRIQNYLKGSQMTVTPSQINITGGGNACLTTTSVTMVAKDTCGSKYVTITLFSAYVTNDIAIPFSKGEETMIEVTMEAMAISTRASGDQMYQISKQR